MDPHKKSRCYLRVHVFTFSSDMNTQIEVGLSTTVCFSKRACWPSWPLRERYFKEHCGNLDRASRHWPRWPRLRSRPTVFLGVGRGFRAVFTNRYLLFEKAYAAP